MESTNGHRFFKTVEIFCINVFVEFVGHFIGQFLFGIISSRDHFEKLFLGLHFHCVDQQVFHAF